MPTRIVLLGLFLLALLAATVTAVTADDDGDVCGFDQSNDPNLVSANCRFEGKGNLVEPYGLIRPYWNPFVVSGSPHFDTLDTHNAYGWLPDHQGDQKIETFGKPWSAGIWQRVPNVVVGQGYRADAGWVVSQNSLAEGRIGIDPTGGSDPLSPNILWSKPIRVCSALRCRHSVQAYAANNSISVWVQVTITTTQGPDNAWISAVGVKMDKTMPAATATSPATPRPTATNTRLPPTRTATASVTPMATASATATATHLPTLTPTPSAAATATTRPAATATSTASATATPTLPPAALVAVAESQAALGGVAVTLLVFLGAGGLVLYRMRGSRMAGR